MMASSLEVLGDYLEPLLDDAVKDALDGVVGARGRRGEVLRVPRQLDTNRCRWLRRRSRSR